VQRVSADPAILATRQDHLQALAAMHPSPRSSPKMPPSILRAGSAGRSGCWMSGGTRRGLAKRGPATTCQCCTHEKAAESSVFPTSTRSLRLPQCFSRLKGGSGLRSWINERACSILVSKERSKSGEHTPSSQNNLSITVQLTAAAALLGPAGLLGREAGSPVGPARVW
jgi:hypothetical protein